MIKNIKKGSIEVYRLGDPNQVLSTRLKEDVAPQYTPGLADLEDPLVEKPSEAARSLDGDNLEGHLSVPIQAD